MKTKWIFPILLSLGLAAVTPKNSSGQVGPCDAANVQPSSLRCAFGIKPLSLPPLITGQIYVSGSDLTQQPHATFLYPNQNTMPAAHRVAGNAIAASLQPLDVNGKVDLVNGKIAAIAEGISNTRLEMDAFWFEFIQNNPAVNPQFKFVNLSEGGCDLVCWFDKGVGAIDPQVQIALLKHSNNLGQFSNGAPKNPAPPFTTIASKRFPTHAQTTHGMLRKRILDLKVKYPNLKLLYITSRCYGGWKCSPADPEANCEPVAYEEGFSVKWLVEGQVTGSDSLLIYSGPNPKAPWMAWGPYLWDSSWPQDWFQPNSAHPCAPGLTHVAKQWYDFLMLDSTTRTWFRDNVAPTVPANLSAKVFNSSRIDLSWNAAADNAGFVKYRLFRDGVLLKVAAGTSYSDTGLKTGTRYCYTVSAADSAGNESAKSNQVCVTIVPTRVLDHSPQPLSFALMQNHPNPVGLETEIRFQLPEAGGVEVKIYNTFGEEIRTLVNASYASGQHSVRWDGKDAAGNVLVNGVYFCRLRAGGLAQVRKMTLLR